MATTKATPCKVALQRFLQIKEINLEEAEKVRLSHPFKEVLKYYLDIESPLSRFHQDLQIELWGQCPPIDRIDGASFAALSKCKHLALSTNSIDRLSGLQPMQQLEILSLGRNCLKKLDGIEAVAGTLKELWVSYNQLERLAGIETCKSLRVFYASNNKLRDWGEIDRLSQLPNLEDVLLTGNPLYIEHKEAGTLPRYRLQVIKRLPQLKKLDGQAVTGEEKDAAAAEL